MADLIGAPAAGRPPMPTAGPLIPERRTFWTRFRALSHIPRLGLRARVILAFSVGSLLLSLLLSGLVLGVTRTNLVNSAESSATSVFYRNARIVRSAGLDPANIERTLASLRTPSGGQPLLFIEGFDDPFSTGGELNSDALPQRLRESVADGVPARMRFERDGVKLLAIGVPIADINGDYFEIVSLDGVDDTLTSISFTLFGASITTIILGAALGWYSSRRILRPLSEVGIAAQALAAGRLDARIETLVDPDLEPIVTSFNGMASTLEDRIDRDARFASDVSHELRSPLMTLQAAVEVLENNRDEMPERAQSALALLSSDIERFTQLVEDLLEISRFDAGVMTLDLQDVVLPTFIQWAIGASGHNAHLTADPELSDVVLAVDKRRIARVLANLLENAAKYGDGATDVTIVSDGDEIKILVDDSGPGVPPEDRDKIFERFNRASAAHRRGGAGGVGLGLSLVSEHVRLHGGRVFVDDAPSGGARFGVVLPRIELPEDHDTEPMIGSASQDEAGRDSMNSLDDYDGEFA